MTRPRYIPPHLRTGSEGQRAEGPNPSGLCRCGCGQRTAIATQNHTKFGYVVGTPVKYLRGHSRRGPEKLLHSNGYVRRLAPNDERAHCGRVYEHVAVVETALGHPLPPRARVHHVNEDKADNRNANLVACEDDAYHLLLHRRLRALRACGNPNFRPCARCRKYDDPAAMQRHSRHSLVHRACKKAYREGRKVIAV